MRILASALAACALSLAGCATSARQTLENRFESIGIPTVMAECMADDLYRRLSDDDLADLVRFSRRMSRADSASEAVRELRRIENPRAVAAIGSAAVECITGFRL